VPTTIFSPLMLSSISRPPLAPHRRPPMSRSWPSFAAACNPARGRLVLLQRGRVGARHHSRGLAGL